jgi:hypothetical protein
MRKSAYILVRFVRKGNRGSLPNASLGAKDFIAKDRGMVQIVFVFCLLASPTQCQEKRAPSASLSVMECIMDAQRQAQFWLADHPEWSLARWRCEAGAPPENHA